MIYIALTLYLLGFWTMGSLIDAVDVIFKQASPKAYRLLAQTIWPITVFLFLIFEQTEVMRSKDSRKP